MSLFERVITEMREAGREVTLTTEELFKEASDRLTAIEAKVNGSDGGSTAFDDLAKRVEALEGKIGSTVSSDASAVEDRVSKLEAEVFGDGAGNEGVSDLGMGPASTAAQEPAPEPTAPVVDPAETAASPTSNDSALDRQTAEAQAMAAAANAPADQTAGKTDPQQNTAENAPVLPPVPLPNTDASHPADEADPLKSFDPAAQDTAPSAKA